MVRSGSAERERESLHARTQKLDFELAIGDRVLLPDQLVHPLFGHRAVARFIDVNAVSSDPAPTVFVKGARYDKMIEAFGGVGVNATSPDELRRAVNEAMDSGKPTLINAVIDPKAGSESGRIGNLNPQSKLKKK